MKDLADSKYKVFGWQVQWEDGTHAPIYVPMRPLTL